METSYIQIRDFKPNKKAFPKKLRMHPKIISSVFVYDVFEMFKTFVKLHLILRMLKNALRIVPNHFRLLSDVHTNIQDCFTNGTELFSINEEYFVEWIRNDSECSAIINDKV